MKILVPLFHELPLESGFGVKYPSQLTKDRTVDISLQIRLWRGFEVLAEKVVSFEGRRAFQVFLPDLFNETELQSVRLATVEFLPANGVSVSGNYEIQLLLRSADRQNWASLLFDLIPDKKVGHKYSPILHSAHTAFVESNSDTYVLMVNFRPPYLREGTESGQSLLFQLKTAEGKLLGERVEPVEFNDTTLVSFEKEFAAYGGFQPGCQLNIKGGKSQFAIFTLFYNRTTHAIGIEHSLPPIYYCSAIYQPENRVQFYDNAFKGTRDLI